MYKITREMIETLELTDLDVCAVYNVIDWTYGSGGSVLIFERPSAHSVLNFRYYKKPMAIRVQLARMSYKPIDYAEYFDLTHDQRIYYKYIVQSWGLP